MIEQPVHVQIEQMKVDAVKAGKPLSTIQLGRKQWHELFTNASQRRTYVGEHDHSTVITEDGDIQLILTNDEDLLVGQAKP